MKLCSTRWVAETAWLASVRVSAETLAHLTLQSSSFLFVPSVCLFLQNKLQKTRGQSCQDEALGYKWEEWERHKWGGRKNSLAQGLPLSLSVLDFIPSSQRASNTWAWEEHCLAVSKPPLVLRINTSSQEDCQQASLASVSYFGKSTHPVKEAWQQGRRGQRF